jgi:hypothetical protein
MEYERHHYCKESSTTAKTALGLSIGALGVELLGAGGGGILSGLLGRPQNATVTAELLPMILALVPLLNGKGMCCNGGTVSALEAEVAQLRAEKYSDLGNINTFKEAQSLVDKNDEKYGARFEKIFDELVANRVSAARQEEQIKCLEQRLIAKIDAGDQALANAIAVESERRMNGDNGIRDWVACNYVPWKRVLDSSLLCPPVQLATTAGGASNAQPTNVVVSGTVTTQAAAA